MPSIAAPRSQVYISVSFSNPATVKEYLRGKIGKQIPWDLAETIPVPNPNAPDNAESLKDIYVYVRAGKVGRLQDKARAKLTVSLRVPLAGPAGQSFPATLASRWTVLLSAYWTRVACVAQ